MASPRVPLNELPNVANSRFHAIATAAQKRPRPTSELKHEILYTREPSAKRQLVDPRGSRVNSPAKRANVKVFEDPNTQGAAQPVRGQQSSHDSVARHTQIQQTNPQAQQQTEQGVQQQNPHPDRLSITEWQNHYLRLFPRFTFYFDGVPEDQRALIVRRMLRLGAQCATFLSNEVTHVITARELVTVKELEDEKENTVKLASSRLRQQEEHIAGADGHGKMLLEQHATDGARIRPPRSAFTFEAPSLSKAVQTRQATQSTAVSQARKMGKKVWSAHKLIKILDAILNNDSQRNSLHRPARGTDQQVKQPEKELQNLLRHEKLHGPADRDRSVPVKEEVPFVGHYFVINDMNGQYKPIMIREYPKPAGGFTEGDWPQFRTSTQGRSPFLLDEAAMRKRQKAEEAAIALQKSGQAITRSRAALVEKYAMNPPLQRSRIPSNREQIGGKHVGQINGHSREPSLNSGNFLPTINRTSSANAGSWGTFRDMSSRRGMWEPAASGVQPSNVTSAIRSQSISSAAVIPGSRAAISKNVIDLKRRAFENNSAPHRLTHSQGMSNLNAVAEGQQQPAPVRPLKRRIGEQLDVLDEEETSVLDAGPDEHPEEADDLSRRKAEAEQACRQAARAKRVLAAKKQTAAASEQQQQQPPERVKKPGYCENCREKYEDFDVHVVGPRHRKFAVDRRNWADLDQLLVQVRRPMRQEVRWGC